MTWWKAWWRPRPPAWARFFTKTEYYWFIDLIHQYFTRRQQRYVLEVGVVRVLDGMPGGVQRCGLLNLAQRCKQEGDLGQWGELVAVHFDGFRQHLVESEKVQELAQDFERVAPLLARHCVFRSDVPGTVTGLVYDLPTSIQNVRPCDVEHWDREPDELFQMALDNVRLHSIPTHAQVEVGEGLTLEVLSGADYYVATHALLLDEHPRCLGRHGALVGVPHRHAVLSFPIEDAKVLQVVQRMLAAIIGMEREGPGSISSQLYWYHEGNYAALPYRLERQRLIVEPPEPFLELLESMTSRDDDDPADR
ncbi:MAG TPA: hypothetical protein PKD86_07730 [Gemmatales bacterium]|nr:hypothetical protein [Gemmatales bacterium]